MARIKISIPDTVLFECIIPVRITDVNYGNHVGNDSLVGIIHEARIQWLKSLGLSEINCGGTSIIMGDLAVEYKHEAFHGDLLCISITVADIKRASFDICYSIKNQQAQLVAIAKTGIVCFDYNSRKVVEMGNELRNKLL